MIGDVTSGSPLYPARYLRPVRTGVVPESVIDLLIARFLGRFGILAIQAGRQGDVPVINIFSTDPGLALSQLPRRFSGFLVVVLASSKSSLG